MIELMVTTIIGLGLYNWYITTKYHNAKEQITEAHELILQMARELQDLGSPNVKVIEREEY